jgi:hypothetical protein
MVGPPRYQTKLMSTHYHCTYQHAPGECRLYKRHVWHCPWPHMVLLRAWSFDLDMYKEYITIGLN